MLYLLQCVEPREQESWKKKMNRLVSLFIALSVFVACQSVPAPVRQIPPDAKAPAAGPEVLLVVIGTVYDRPAFMQGYASKLPPLYAKYGGTYLAVSGKLEHLEGEPDFESLVISRWPSAAAAREFWNSPEYRALADARITNRWGDFKVVLVPALPSVVETN
jgi:uncharacterized protein (DUF1330 family)